MTRVMRNYWKEILNVITLVTALVSLLGVPFLLGQKYEQICGKLDVHEKELVKNDSEHDRMKANIGALRDGYIKQHGYLK